MPELLREVGIRDLTPQSAVAWKLKARVISRSATRSMRDSGSSSFSVTLVDANGGEIRAIAYNEAVDTFADVLSPGKVCWFENCMLRTTKRTVSSSGHRYEIVIDNDADVMESEDDSRIPQTSYHFARLSDIAKAPVGTLVDILVAMCHVDTIEEITGRDGKPYTRRSVVLASDENLRVGCTFWGDLATQQLTALTNRVIALKNCRVEMAGFAQHGQNVERESSRVPFCGAWQPSQSGSRLSRRCSRGGRQSREPSHNDDA